MVIIRLIFRFVLFVCVILYVLVVDICFTLDMFLVMKTNTPFRVRVLLSYPLCGEKNYYDLTWQQAVEKFEFFVSCCLAFPELNIRCVNIIKGKRKSIKLFINHE